MLTPFGAGSGVVLGAAEALKQVPVLLSVFWGSIVPSVRVTYCKDLLVQNGFNGIIHL